MLSTACLVCCTVRAPVRAAVGFTSSLIHLALDVTEYLGYSRTARCSKVLCVQRTLDFNSITVQRLRT